MGIECMLIKKEILDLIKSGDVTLAFRRWRKPTVKSGGTLRTAIGELFIRRVMRTTARNISAKEAQRAGYDGKAALLADLGGREGNYYRIELTYAGEDARIALREKDRLSGTELADIVKRLSRMDTRSAGGPWTTTVLEAIHAYPKLVSTELAAKLEVERDWLKPNIRKLKNLGLTISHECGYTLSPRGRCVLQCLARGID